MFIFHFIALGCSYFGILCLNHNFSSKNGCSNSKVNILVFETDTLLLKLQLSEVDLDIGFTLNTHFLLKDFNSVYNPFQSISSAQMDGILHFRPGEDFSKTHQQYVLRLQLYNQDLETFCGVPLNLAFKPNLQAAIDLSSGVISYLPINKENHQDEFAILARLKLRYHFDPILDYINSHPEKTLLSREEEVISNIQKAPLAELTSYNVIHRSFYLCNVQRNPMFKRFIHHIMRRLEYLATKEQIPFIICEDKDGQNPLGEALDRANGLLAQSILQICITYDEESGLLYSGFINLRL